MDKRGILALIALSDIKNYIAVRASEICKTMRRPIQI